VEQIGADNTVWASDYPHWDSDYPPTSPKSSWNCQSPTRSSKRSSGLTESVSTICAEPLTRSSTAPLVKGGKHTHTEMADCGGWNAPGRNACDYTAVHGRRCFFTAAVHGVGVARPRTNASPPHPLTGSRPGRDIHGMFALCRCSRQVVVTEEQVAGPAVMGKRRGARQRRAHHPDNALTPRGVEPLAGRRVAHPWADGLVRRRGHPLVGHDLLSRGRWRVLPRRCRPLRPYPLGTASAPISPVDGHPLAAHGLHGAPSPRLVGRLLHPAGPGLRLTPRARPLPRQEIRSTSPRARRTRGPSETRSGTQHSPQWRPPAWP
jgi:hypothetical protein